MRIYLYAHANPANNVDPSGHDISLSSVLTASSIGAVIGAAASSAANHAMGQAITLESVLKGAAIGAVLGPGALLPSTAVGLGAGGLLVGGSFLPVLTDPGATTGQKVAAAGLFVASVWGAHSGFTYVRSARVQQLPEGVTPEPMVMLYHKGELQGGVVSGNRALSLGIERGAVQSLNRGGKVWEFEVPARRLIELESEGGLTRLRDTDLETGMINSEVRIEAGWAQEFTKYIKTEE